MEGVGDGDRGKERGVVAEDLDSVVGVDDGGDDDDIVGRSIGQFVRASASRQEE